MKCPYCGFELPEGTHFCSECGKDLHAMNADAPEVVVSTEDAAALAEETAEVIIIPAPEVETAAEETGEEPLEDAAVEVETAAVQEPVQDATTVPMMESAASAQTKVYHGVLDKKPEKHSRWATIGTWGWFGILLLLSIPIVNIICLFVWSFGGAKKQVKQSFARATLIMGLLTAILSVVSAILLHQFAPVILDQLAVWFAF